MSGPKPRQQKSRSPKGKVVEPEIQVDDLDVLTKEEAIETAKAVEIEKVATTDFGSWIEPDDTTDQNGDGSSDDEEGEA